MEKANRNVNMIVRLTPEEKRELDQFCSETDKTMSKFVRSAYKKEMAREKKKKRT